MSSISRFSRGRLRVVRLRLYLLIGIVLVSGGAFAADSTPGGGSSSVSQGGAVPTAPTNNTVAGINAAYEKTQSTLAADYKRRIDEVKKQIEAINEQIRRLNAKREELRRLIAKLDAEIAELEKQTQSATQSVIASKLKTLQEIKNARAKEIQDGERKTEELKATLAALNRQSLALSAEFQQAVARLKKEQEQALKNARR